MPPSPTSSPRRSGRPAGARYRDAAVPARRPAAQRAQSPYARHAHPQRSGRRRPAPKRGGHAGSPWPVLIALAAAAAVVAVAVIVVIPALFNAEHTEVAAGQEVTITVPEGASGDAIAKLLVDNHVVSDASSYYAAVDKLGAESSLKPGDYRFVTGQDATSVVKQLVAGPNLDNGKLTVPEGKTVAQTAALVESVLGIPASDFIAQAKAFTYASDYPFLAQAANDSLEGFLYPKTYSFTDSPTADTVIRAMLDQYQSDVANALDFDAARASIQATYGVEMTDYQFLTLASIIEREALTSEQRYKVSSVFYNRLQQGMPLQSDATMMYVTGGEVTAEDLKKQDPYNTYLNAGVTPTPICAPSLDSLKAALAPASTDYLYFFITQSEEYFSQTYDQHLQAIEENR